MTRPELEAGIVTTDAERLVRFYCDGLGFEVLRLLELPQGTVHRLGRGVAGLKIFQPAAPPTPNEPAAAWDGRAGFAYAALHVDDAHATVAAAVSAGAAVLTGVTNHRPGAHYALIADPDRNVWEILQEEPGS